ncbi:T9SS type A sorting domain-containing protein [Bizionia sp.]|uniref:T9SS type A sorting domain-containing protein n=1 Tax=Bizionia sp. TaxID=1954480 RepID=UPI003A8F38AF
MHCIILQEGNRNPYIDNPYIATLIWGGTTAEDTWGTLGLDDEITQTLNIYPTITKDYIYIKGNYSNLNYTIYNALGQEVIRSKSVSPIDVSSLNKGLYMLKIQLPNSTKSKKIIKI